MRKLKPIGSEKLEGMAKINRMIELAKYRENKPQNINEDSSNEYSIKLADGHKYHIIKEKNGYVLKKGLNESVLEYLEPMKNRKYYSSYSQALKRLNLITKEVNISEGKDSNVSLFTEGEEGEKKYYLSLKRSTNEQAPPAEQLPVPAPAPAPAPAASTPPPADVPEPSPEPPAEDMEMPPMEDETEPTEPSEESETVTFKTIQKLTGKLGQKLRTLNADEENKMSSKDVKYVINSILSALDLNSLEDEDKEEIMSKFEGGEEESSMETGMEGEELPEPSPEGEEVPIETPEPPSEEVGEEYHSIDEYDFEKEMDEYDMMEDMIEGIFSESKVDKVLKGYFKLNENENNILKNKKKLTETVNKHSVSISQKVASKKFINENKNVKFVGKTNHDSLVFKQGNKQIKITNKGQII